MNQNEYVEKVTEQIRCKQARDCVAEEMMNHIEDQKDAFKQGGMTEGEAMEAAVLEMGDPVEVGVELDHVHRPRMEWRFLAFIIGLSLLSMSFQVLFHGSRKQMLTIVVGSLIMIGICYLDYSLLGKYATALILGYLILFWIVYTFHPIMVNGSRGWTNIGPIMVSFRSVLYLYVPLYGAYLYAQRGKRFGLLKAITFGIIPVGLAFFMPSVSTTASLWVMLLAVLSVALVKGWIGHHKKLCLSLLWGGTIVLPLGLFGFLLAMGRVATYQLERLKSIVFYQAFGTFSASEMEEYVEAHRFTEAIIMYLKQYCGMVAALAFVAVITFLVIKLFHISFKQKNQLGMIVGFGCGMVFAVQTLGYVLYNFNIIPEFMMYLPLFSAGVSDTLVSYCLLGLVLSIYRYQDVLPRDVKQHRWKMIRVLGKEE